MDITTKWSSQSSILVSRVSTVLIRILLWLKLQFTYSQGRCSWHEYLSLHLHFWVIQYAMVAALA